MTDHADTIRRCLRLRGADEETTIAFAALDALLAERQQLQEERDDAERRIEIALGQRNEWADRATMVTEQRDALRAERQQAQKQLGKCDEALTALRNEKWKVEAELQQAQQQREWEFTKRGEALAKLAKCKRERQQAIDALREIARRAGEYNFVASKAARAALVKLGEKPQ